MSWLAQFVLGGAAVVFADALLRWTASRRARPVKLKIRYRSGHQQVFRCKEFTIQRAGGQVAQMAWDKAQPNPTLIGLDDIESVWRIG